MRFTGNPSLDLDLDYHIFSEFEKDGNLITRYILSSPVDSDKEKELAEYENIKLVRNGATHKYAPEIKYDVLYISGSLDENEDSATEYVGENNFYNESEILGKLDNEIFGGQGDSGGELSKYASVTSAIENLNSQILLYKTLANQFPEDSVIYVDLISESEVQLGKLASLVTTKETSDNMAKGLEEGKELEEGILSLDQF